MNAKAQRYEEKAAVLMHNANIASEKGKFDKAEELYAKAQVWMDKMNEALGNA